MSSEKQVERGIIVFSNWAVFGFVGLGFLLEGVTRDEFAVSLIGVAGIAGGFIGHLVINFAFKQPFTSGETSLGLAVFGLTVLVFLLGWMFAGLSDADVFTGLTLISVLLLGFFAYVATRYGVKGSFSTFHHKHPEPSEPRK